MILIGESIHTTSRKISEAIEGRDPKPIQELALLQAARGANYLDINLGPVSRHARETTQWVLNTVQDVVDLPLAIDTVNLEAIEAALQVCRKTPLINCASNKSEDRPKLELAQKYSADVIVMTFNDEGMPSDADERAACVMSLVDTLEEIGLGADRVWVDGVLLPACINQDQVVQYFEFLKILPDLAPGMKTVCGLSNISSCGTPAPLRGVLNRALFVMLERYGQTAVIADVTDDELLRLIRGEMPEIRDLIHRAMDGEEFEPGGLAPQALAYVKSVDVLLKRKLYSHSWLES